MMRIHFTPDDLRRVTIAGPEVLTELVASAHAFTRRHLPEHDRRRFAHDLTPATRPLLQLTADPKGFPDFLTPATGDDFETGLEAVLSTPPEQIRTEMAQFARLAWMRDPNRVRAALGSAVRAYRHDVFAPHWDSAAANVAADRAVRAQTLIDGGVELLLTTLHPSIDWSYPVLTLPCVAQTDFYLHGQGVRLVPTHFQHVPAIADRPGGPFEVYYPARADMERVARVVRLQPLLGRTRAAVLVTVGSGATTSQIARRLGISVASASEHATVLRNAGLIASRRVRNTVIHTLTPLGAELVPGSHPGAKQG